jgi:hypothetical protein
LVAKINAPLAGSPAAATCALAGTAAAAALALESAELAGFAQPLTTRAAPTTAANGMKRLDCIVSPYVSFARLPKLHPPQGQGT